MFKWDQCIYDTSDTEPPGCNDGACNLFDIGVGDVYCGCVGNKILFLSFVGKVLMKVLTESCL